MNRGSTVYVLKSTKLLVLTSVLLKDSSAMYLTVLIHLYNNMYMHLRPGNGVNICDEIK